MNCNILATKPEGMQEEASEQGRAASPLIELRISQVVLGRGLWCVGE